MQLTWQQSLGIEQTHLVTYTDSLGHSHQVHKDIVADLTQLSLAASQDGVAITLVSAFRSFERQLAIWNDKWQGYRPVYSRHGRPLNIESMSDIERYKAISLWSAMPGMSRHHWGTDLDIFAAEAVSDGYKVELIPAEFEPGGPCEALGKWLQDNLSRFGFFRPYQEFQGGVSQEPWHISHYKTSNELLKQFDFDNCQKYLRESAIKSAEFINHQFDHYRQQYFCNICEPT